MNRWFSLAVALTPSLVMSEACSPQDEGNDSGAMDGSGGSGSSEETDTGGSSTDEVPTGGRSDDGGAPSGDGGMSSGSAGEGGLGGGSGEGTGGSSDPCAGGCPEDLWDIDGNPLTGSCGCEYSCSRLSETIDVVEDDYVDANCDGGDGVVDACVYVSTSVGDDTTGAGTRQSPVQTIAHAQTIAQALGVSSVCLSGELYSETVSEVPGITIHLNFDHQDPDFQFRRSPNVVTTFAL